MTRKVYDFVLQNDGKVIERMTMDVYPPGRKYAGGPTRPWKLRTAILTVETRAGRLAVRPMGAWLACRFDEPGRAVETLNEYYLPILNKTSGKWNFHFGAYTSAAEAFATFEAAVKSIL